MTEELIENTNDYELIMLYRENDDDAKNILFLKYKFIIDILIKKNQSIINMLNIDMQEVYSECTVGFSDALRSFQEDKEATLPSFITLCIERRLMGLIRKYNCEKYKVIKESYSLDYYYEDVDKNLMEILVDNSYEPLINITEEESYEELIKDIQNKLSNQEKDVFKYMIKGFNYQQIAKILELSPKKIDNTIQRVKLKIKNILETRKEQV